MSLDFEVSRDSVGDEVGLTRTQRQWLKHIRRCNDEQLSYQAYCLREGLGVKGLYAARKQLVAKGVLPSTRGVSAVPPRFAAVRLSQPSASLTLEALLPNGVQVRLGCADVASSVPLIDALARL